MHVTGTELAELARAWEASDPEVAAARAGLDDTLPARPPGLGLQIDGVGKSFGARTVLRDISLRIAPGSFVALVGRSGCGKSTLLRLLAGLEQADTGSFTRDSDASPGDVRLMFQDARLLPWQRVIDNVALGLPRPEAHARAREALAQVGLAERAGDWPAVLSGGQRQRVALARALVHRPRLLLLDEPLGALDALTRIEMHALIESLWTRHGFTAVLVTHDVSEAVALADRVLLIDQHRIAFDAAVPLARPRSRGAPEFAAFEAQVLQRVLSTPQADAAFAPTLAESAWPAHGLRWAV
ncbi:MAG TPA: ATP-binding cassette domain-containing protein [Burkholderiaceae bacterium]|nr:ATP-binding cassette domain-containing protein [Burkholderiaceae bacterium]